MLPDILDVADQNGLIINSFSKSREEVLCKCPFCHEDSKPGKKRRYYLSLNTKDQVFKCWFCGESGGVLRFISLLEGVPEEQVRQRYRKRKVVHPAERLSRNQRKWLRQHIGGTEPNWKQMRERDFAYYKRSLDLLWQQWNEFLEIERQGAYLWLIIGIKNCKYQKYIERIRHREREIEVPLLEDLLQIYSCAVRPKWTEDAERFVCNLKTVSPEPEKAGVKTEDN
ncbi:hypothetical protein [Paenibacillus senegalimassiliensis]|uniref:hypothetical protein n=1 Tax=Paenibacillus senegalimassiliensis TaxID=1737426 RepID=UPI00073EA54A|nr:hypothetical protein [Paenibacillus senegalimassiliensis]